MARAYHRLLLLFVDGLGLAPSTPDNPLAAATWAGLQEVLGGPLTFEQAGEGERHVLLPLDAVLETPGLPQSATGQTTLFCGVNAAKWMDRHVTGLPGPRLRTLIAESNLFVRAVDAGLQVTFANAYSESYLDALGQGRARPSVTTCAALSAGLTLRTVRDLESGRAVTWDVVGDLFSQAAAVESPLIDPRVAGERLICLAAEHHLTVFETFLPDLVGHRRIDLDRREVVRRLVGLVDGALAAAGEEITVVLTSDHGNFEQRSTRSHTANPVPLLAVGPAARLFSGLQTLVDVAPRILEVLAEVPQGASS